MSDITLTKEAIAYIQKNLQSREGVLGIRLGVNTAGCSGLSYVVDFAKSIKPEDKIFEAANIKIMVDADSFNKYLKGTEIDCVREGLNEYLKFNNPNVTSHCGCGESFNVS
jgi:iron-sulfur cluster assembly protein